ncbi:Phosphoglycerate mutase-like protein AT74 [Linum perenne]
MATLLFHLPPPSNLTAQCCINSNELHIPTNGNPVLHPLISNGGSRPRPPRPRRIILVRHGQSEGNVDENAYTRVADPKIELTQKGKAQAEECGRRIRELIEKNGAAEEDWKVYFYVSPYKRTRQTLQHLGKAFERGRISGVREEPRLREQDFGNFQDRERMRVEKVLRNLYGRFFFRFPNGESAADVYDRITGVFLMRWYKWTVEQYERLHNFGNAGMLVMEKGYGGRYSLLMHHSEEELRQFGLTEEMLNDQEW